ncbi:uncharacterized protein LOC122858103 [Aphidius gifuensis]|uniref:uncharacterized protein LOC122858103 n=1 Tax=Aphidius gifuensis TaxID=684658 RepID=UPI001CDC8FFE|nr:uncharacterized protein LOC122858103 [Aphidius gifuensis]
MKICGLILSLAVLISLIEFKITATSNPEYQYDVLLGGETDSLLKNEARTQLTNLNLKIAELSNDSMKIEVRNGIIGNSTVLLYVLDKDSRNSLTMNEIAYLLGTRCDSSSLYVVFTIYDNNQYIKGEPLSNTERYDLNYAMDVLQYLALRHHVKIFNNLSEAMDRIKTFFHKVKTPDNNDDDDDDSLDQECRLDILGDIQDAEDELIEETTTEAIEATTIIEEEPETFAPYRKRRSFQNVGTNDNDEDSHATGNDDDNDDGDDDDDDDEYLSDQCEIETGFDPDDTDIPQYNTLINQANVNPSVDDLFNNAVNNQSANHPSSMEKLTPKYAWKVLQEHGVCPTFLPKTQDRLIDSLNPIDKEAFKLIVEDCMSFKKESGSTCKTWGKGNPGSKSSLYYGAFNVSSDQQPQYCQQLLKNYQNILCYNPNLNQYDISQIGVEMNHLNISRSKLFYVPNNNYVNALTVMASYLIGVKAENLFLVINGITINIKKHHNLGRNFTTASQGDYNRGRKYLQNLALHCNVHTNSTIAAAEKVAAKVALPPIGLQQTDE